MRIACWGLTAWLMVALPLPGWAQPAANPSSEAVVIAARGRNITLDLTAETGGRAGAVYELKHGDRMVARLRVQQVGPSSSTATVTEMAEDQVLAVGDTVHLLRVEATPPEPAPEPAPEPVTNPSPGPKPAPPALPANVLVSAIDGNQVTLEAGARQGVSTALNLPVWRADNIIGIVKVQIVRPTTSTATILWQDATARGILVGDLVAVPAPPALPPPGPGGITVIQQGPEIAVPLTPVPYETGSSNAVVPHNDRAYELLAALAAGGLITSQPAGFFQQQGTRFHQTEEDVNLTRSQIAQFIAEALDNANTDSLHGRDQAALAELTADYDADLRAIGTPPPSLPAAKHFQIGFSGFDRATLTGGDTRGFMLPFSEPNGDIRTRSGLESTTNIFGRLNDRVSFFATVDSGNQPSRDRKVQDFKVRQGLVAIKANSLLRGLSFELGRNEMWWGPGHFGSLTLSDASGPLDMARVLLDRGSWKLEGFFAPLPRGPEGSARSLYGHKLEFQLGNQARVGISETLLLEKDSLHAGFAAASLLPIPLSVLERTVINVGNRANLTNSAYVESSVGRGVQAYGELLLDDLGIPPHNVSRNRIGTLIGAHLFKPGAPDKMGVYLEYASLQGRTYLNLTKDNTDLDYYNHGIPLGYPVAPPRMPGPGGATSLRLHSYLMPMPKLHLGAGIELSDLESEADQPPSHIVGSRQEVLRLNASYDFAHNWSLTARALFIQTAQPNFIVGEPELKQRLYQLELSRSW